MGGGGRYVSCYTISEIRPRVKLLRVSNISSIGFAVTVPIYYPTFNSTKHIY